MKQITKKILCFCIVITMIACTFVGCGGGDGGDLIPEELTMHPIDRMINDKYERNDEITDEMTYTMGYLTPIDTYYNDFEVLPLFEHIKIQVDGWQCVTVGVTTMAELVQIIDQTNEAYIKEKTNALIAERQAAIDAEYEAAVKKAQEKGKTYDKPKKEVRTDDIHFEAPYTYDIRFGDYDDTTKEYQPTLLINPLSTGLIYFNVYKYNIPYVVFDFSAGDGRYVSRITQESEWIMNGAAAASLSLYAQNNETDAELSAKIVEITDVDGRNKIAKQNMYMSGNIAFGGEGFTWNSLMLLCDALNLVEDDYYHSFSQSSNSEFTFYTIILHTNIFDSNLESNLSTKYVFPSIKLVATFDPLTQVCINWTIETYSQCQSFSDMKAEFGETFSVNVHEYKVDTNDYAGMRQSIKDWIAQNSVQTTTKYVAFDEDDGKMFGVVENGLHNVTVEIEIDGTVYTCIDYFVDVGGTIYGQYVSEEDMAASEQIEDPVRASAYIKERAKSLRIDCCVFDEQGKIIGTVYADEHTLQNAQGKYYIADYNWTDSGYGDVRVLTNDMVYELLLTYAKVYRLSAAQSDDMRAVFNQDGLVAVKTYINDLFAEAEAQQGKK